jgi:hypothetical protein
MLARSLLKSETSWNGVGFLDHFDRRTRGGLLAGYRQRAVPCLLTLGLRQGEKGDVLIARALAELVAGCH